MKDIEFKSYPGTLRFVWRPLLAHTDRSFLFDGVQVCNTASATRNKRISKSLFRRFCRNSRNLSRSFDALHRTTHLAFIQARDELRYCTDQAGLLCYDFLRSKLFLRLLNALSSMIRPFFDLTSIRAIEVGETCCTCLISHSSQYA